MLLGEVMSALDPELVAEVLQSLRRFRENGMTMLIVTHEMRFAREVSDRVTFFHHGKLAEVGSVRQSLYEPADECTAKFLGKVSA